MNFGRSAKFTRHVIKVDKKAIEAAVTDHTRRHGSISEQEVASDTDLLIGHFTQLNDAGEPLEGGIESDSNIALEHLDDKTRKALTGAKVGDTFDVDPHKVSHGHDDLGKMLGITHEQVHDLKGNSVLKSKKSSDSPRGERPKPVGQGPRQRRGEHRKGLPRKSG